MLNLKTILLLNADTNSAMNMYCATKRTKTNSSPASTPPSWGPAARWPCRPHPRRSRSPRAIVSAKRIRGKHRCRSNIDQYQPQTESQTEIIQPFISQGGMDQDHILVLSFGLPKIWTGISVVRRLSSQSPRNHPKRHIEAQTKRAPYAVTVLTLSEWVRRTNTHVLAALRICDPDKRLSPRFFICFF